MFSSEQIFDINGEMNQLEMTINFAMRMHDIPKEVSFQITNDGKYCLGWVVDEKKGWLPFPFDFDAHIVAEIVKQHLYKQDVEDPYENCDGSSYKGFRMKAIYGSFSSEEDGIKYPFYGIVSIEPEYIFYAK